MIGEQYLVSLGEVICIVNLKNDLQLTDTSAFNINTFCKPSHNDSYVVQGKHCILV